MYTGVTFCDLTTERNKIIQSVGKGDMKQTLQCSSLQVHCTRTFNYEPVSKEDISKLSEMGQLTMISMQICCLLSSDTPKKKEKINLY